VHWKPKKKKKYWTVLRTKQPNSADARRHITREGFEILHLMYRKRPKNGVREIMPLFPYYLLVRIDPNTDRWKWLNSTRGVRRVIQNGGGLPTCVKDEHVQRFREIEDELGYVAVPEHEAPRFNMNETLEIQTGWLKGCTGIYRGLAGTSHDRIRVLFTVLGVPKMLEIKAYDAAVLAA